MFDVHFVFPSGVKLQHYLRLFCALVLPAFMFGAIGVHASIIPANRMVDWINYPPGVQGGIPNRTNIFATLNVDKTGRTDVSSFINAAIAACPPNQVVFLPAGTYLITNTISMQSGVVLRGAGMNQTTLVYSNGNGGDAVGWEIPNPVNNIYYPSFHPPQSNDIYSGFLRGSTNLILVGGEPYTTNFQPGMVCEIDETNVPWMFGSLQSYDYEGRENGSRLFKQLIFLQSVTNGTNFTFRPPLVCDYTNSPQLVYVPPGGLSTNSGVENLSISNAWPYAMNLTGGAMGGNTLDFQQTLNCWAKNVAVLHNAYSGINFYFALNCTVNGCYAADGYEYDSPNHCYGILLANSSSDCLVENSVVYHMRVGIMAGGSGARNVIAYNYCPHCYTESAGFGGSGYCSHGGMPWFNLWEGNVVSGFWCDLFHGSSAYNIIFRNWSTGTDTTTADAKGNILTGVNYPASPDATNQYERCINIEATNYYYSVVGNVLGDPSLVNPHSTNEWYYMATTDFAPNNVPFIYQFGGVGGTGGPAVGAYDQEVSNTTYINGNYDYANDATLWISNRVQTLPASLYLTNQPSWWSNSVPWPPLGPPNISGAPPMTNAIPAELRFEAMMNPTNDPPQALVPPSAPTGLRLIGLAQ